MSPLNPEAALWKSRATENQDEIWRAAHKEYAAKIHELQEALETALSTPTPGQLREIAELTESLDNARKSIAAAEKETLRIHEKYEKLKGQCDYLQSLIELYNSETLLQFLKRKASS